MSVATLPHSPLRLKFLPAALSSFARTNASDGVPIAAAALFDSADR